jgi:hypothetical protein
MKRSGPWLLVFLAMTPCAAHFDRSAALVDYKQALQGAMSQASPTALALRAKLLKLTPVGSLPGQVQHVITDVLHKSGNPYEKNFYTSETSAVNPADPSRLMYVAGCIGIRYDETMHWWGTGLDTDII